jgi:hypothetical protein
LANELIKTQGQLPVTLEGLHKYILIGKEKLKAHKAKIRAIEKVSEGHIAKQAALTDAQDVADALLDAEAKLGELLAEKPIEEKRASSAKGTCSLTPAQTLRLICFVGKRPVRAGDLGKELKKQSHRLCHA